MGQVRNRRGGVVVLMVWEEWKRLVSGIRRLASVVLESGFAVRVDDGDSRKARSL